MSQFIEMTTRSELNKKSIGEIAEVRTGSTPSRSNPEYWNGTHYWVSAQDMGNKYIYDTLEKITDKGYATCKVVPAGSILYVCRGSIGVMSINTMDCATNQSICTATCKKGYNTEYLYYALKVAEKTIKKQGIGTSFKSLNQSAFSSIEILFPAIEIQDKFAAIAKQADKSKFGDFKSQFIEMFGDPLSPIQKWPIVRLGDYCIVNPTKPKGISDEMEVSFIPMQDVSDDGSCNKFINRPYAEVKKGFTYCADGDVIFAKITPCMENGKGAELQGLTNAIGMGSTEFHVLSPISGKSISTWLYHFTKLDIIRKDAAKNMTGTGGQKRVPASYFDNFKIGVPSIDEQMNFAALANQADKSKSYVRIALKNLESI
ncbi:restriction endonuclease subunit S [Bacteroides caecigallinarum]|nr:restriction endonuclease subunit S [Bacteroides caecigallinarum]